jgi:hypothetical protein
LKHPALFDCALVVRACLYCLCFEFSDFNQTPINALQFDKSTAYRTSHNLHGVLRAHNDTSSRAMILLAEVMMPSAIEYRSHRCADLTCAAQERGIFGFARMERGEKLVDTGIEISTILRCIELTAHGAA